MMPATTMPGAMMSATMAPASSAAPAPGSMPARGQEAAQGLNAGFAAVLFDIAKGDVVPDATAKDTGDGAERDAPPSSQKPAAAAASQCGIEAMLAGLTIAPTTGTVAADTPSPASDDVGSRASRTAVIDGRSPSLATSVVAAAIQVAQTAPDGRPDPAIAAPVEPTSTIAGADADMGAAPIVKIAIENHVALAHPTPATTHGTVANGQPAGEPDAAQLTGVKAASVAAMRDQPSADHGGANQESDDAEAPLAASVATASAGVVEAATGNPVQQIADAVTALASDTSHADPAAPTAARASPTRTLILHLAPASLGTITVRLHLADGGLTVRLAVENNATLSLLGHAREALQAAIGGAYKLDQLVIQSANPAASHAGSHDTTRHDTTRSDGGASADPQAGHRRGDESPSPRPRPAPREAAAAGGRGVGGLFV